MSEEPKFKKKDYGIYGVTDERGVLQYVGSTSLSLYWLEYNHRNWEKKRYSSTSFRRALVARGDGWTFRWLVRPYECYVWDIEMVEGLQIAKLGPKLNRDFDPVASSIEYGRYTKEDIDAHAV